MKMDRSVFSSVLSGAAEAEPHLEGTKFRQYLTTIAATLGCFGVGTVLAWTSPVLPKLQNAETAYPGPYLTEAQGSWIGSIVAIGAIFGSLPASRGADYIGRKPVIAILAIPFVISWLMIIFAQSCIILFVARFIAGGVVGAVTGVVPMYIGEIAEASIRGQLGSYIQLMVTLGILFVYVVASFVSYVELNILCGIIPIIFGVLFVLIAPETPLYLLRENRREEAEESLRILRGTEYDIYSELEEIQEQIDLQRQYKQSYREVFTSRAVVRATIVVLGLLGFLSCSGINVIIFYAEKIFVASHAPIEPHVATIVIAAMQVIMTYFSGLVVDRAGRRILLLLSDAVMAVCLLTLGSFFWALERGYNVDYLGCLPVISLSIYISVFALGFGPIPGIMMGELFPLEAKGLALGVVCILASILEFSVVKGFHHLLQQFQFGITFWLFSANCMIGTLFVYFLVPETKNKTLQQIQDELNGRPNKRLNRLRVVIGNGNVNNEAMKHQITETPATTISG